MNAATERRRQDLARRQSVCAASGGRVRVVSHSGEPPNEITVELTCRAAASNEYPTRAAARVRARIQLPARYPFHPPLVFLDPPVYHPNVYPSGQVCLGNKWLPTEGLDLLVKRLAQIITFDPAVLNTRSPANPAAVHWYQLTASRWPAAFPTDSIAFGTAAASQPVIRWKNVDTDTSAWAIVLCANCNQSLRVPHRRDAQLRCPACGHTFRV